MNAPRRFPDTSESLVIALASDDVAQRERAFSVVVRAYREPIVTLLQRKWTLEYADAEDLTQEFFATALEKSWLSRYEAARGRFRTFLRSCLTAFVSTELQAARRLKRGSGAVHLVLDDQTPHPATENELDALFEREWMRSVLGMALDALRVEARAAGRESSLALFERYDIDGADRNDRPTYAELAREFALPVTQVTNYLAWARRQFRGHVLDTVRALSGSDEEYRHDLQSLLGFDPS